MSRDVLISHIGGPIELTKYMKKMDGYDETNLAKIEECHKKAFNQLLAYTYLKNSDKTKYGLLLTGLATQNSLGNNQYPKNIIEANNMLSNHKLDNSRQKKSDAHKMNNNSHQSGKNHDDQESPALYFAQLEGKCYCCGKAWHKSPTCQFKDKPKVEWAINKAKAIEQLHLNTGATAAGPPSQVSGANTNNARSITGSVMMPAQTTSGEATQGWSGAHIQFYQAETMKDWILLNNQSTVSLFSNPKLIKKPLPS